MRQIVSYFLLAISLLFFCGEIVPISAVASNYNTSLTYDVVKSEDDLIKVLSRDNSFYIIQNDFDLKRKECVVGKNSVLSFQGGRIRNGTLIGDETTIDAYPSQIFDSDLTLRGTWKNAHGIPEWFGPDEDGSWAHAIQNCLDVFFYAELREYNYFVNKTIRMPYGSTLKGIGRTATSLTFNITKGKDDRLLKNEIEGCVKIGSACVLEDVVIRCLSKNHGIEMVLVDCYQDWLNRSRNNHEFNSSYGTPEIRSEFFHTRPFTIHRVSVYGRQYYYDHKPSGITPCTPHDNVNGFHVINRHKYQTDKKQYPSHEIDFVVVDDVTFAGDWSHAIYVNFDSSIAGNSYLTGWTFENIKDITFWDGLYINDNIKDNH